MDPLAPSITFFDKETGKGRVTYIGTWIAWGLETSRGNLGGTIYKTFSSQRECTTHDGFIVTRSGITYEDHARRAD